VLNDPFDSVFGVLYVGRRSDYPGLPYDPPARFEHGVKTIVADLPAVGPDEGVAVKVFETRLPAEFFRLELAPSPGHPGAVLATGSGEGELALRMAVAFSEGLLVLDEVIPHV
jgi:hypothetical protein